MREQIEAVVSRTNFGTPSAMKRGRNPKWPYIAIVITERYGYKGRTHNPVGRRAYATRVEAIAAAEQYIDEARADLRAKLADPRMRALREQHGLPREVS